MQGSLKLCAVVDPALEAHGLCCMRVAWPEMIKSAPQSLALRSFEIAGPAVSLEGVSKSSALCMVSCRADLGEVEEWSDAGLPSFSRKICRGKAWLVLRTRLTSEVLRRHVCS
eukprot:14378100-Alexandrium_andersonii.AAC.1